MKLSNATLDLFKNFAKINPQVIFNTGTRQFSLAASRDFFIDARIQESFPTRFAINQLNGLLGVISLYEENDIDIEFGPSELTITGRGGASKITYRYTAEVCINPKPPTLEEADKSLAAYTPKVEFDVQWTSLEWIFNTAKKLALPHFKMESDGVTTVVTNFNKDDNSTSTQSLSIPTATGVSHSPVVFSTSSISMLPDDYTVGINDKGNLRFRGKTMGIDYYLFCLPKQTVTWS